PRRTVPDPVIGGRHVAYPAHIRRQLAVAPAVAAEDKPQVPRHAGGGEEQIVHALLAIGHAVAHEEQITGARRVRWHGEILFRIDRVVHQLRAPGTEAGVRVLDRRAAAIEEDEVVLWNQRSERTWSVLRFRKSRSERL